jgi:hypothetical protein
LPRFRSMWLLLFSPSLPHFLSYMLLCHVVNLGSSNGFTIKVHHSQVEWLQIYHVTAMSLRWRIEEGCRRNGTRLGRKKDR